MNGLWNSGVGLAQFVHVRSKLGKFNLGNSACGARRGAQTANSRGPTRGQSFGAQQILGARRGRDEINTSNADILRIKWHHHLRTHRLTNGLGAIKLNNANCGGGTFWQNDVISQRSALYSIGATTALLDQFNLAKSFKLTRDALPNLRARKRQQNGLTRGLHFDVVGQIIADILQLKISHALGVGL